MVLLLEIALGAAAVVVVALFVIAWSYASLLRRGALIVRPMDRSSLPLTVVASQEGVVTLESHSARDRERLLDAGWWGIEWPGGYGRLGALLSAENNRVSRRFEGDRLPRAGEQVRLDNFCVPRTGHAFGDAATEWRYTSDVGELPMWVTPGDEQRWVVFVHGKGADPWEGGRVFPPARDLGWSTASIAYRNDSGCPGDASGHYGYGAHEWRDLEAAVRALHERGAREIVLFGHSMGGAVVCAFLRHSPLAKGVRGVMLDAPMLCFESTVNHHAALRRMPRPITAAGKRIAAQRFGLNWRALDYRPILAAAGVPALLLHGTADELVPHDLSATFAIANPGAVRLESFEGALHVRSWNVDPERYAALVGQFLGSLDLHPRKVPGPSTDATPGATAAASPRTPGVQR